MHEIWGGGLLRLPIDHLKKLLMASIEGNLIPGEVIGAIRLVLQHELQ